MTLGIGVDILHVPRIAGLLRRRGADKFALKILSTSEYTQWKTRLAVAGADLNHPRVLQFLAVRWCVKEAAYKATYPVIKPTWKELTYHTASTGQKPTLEYRPFDNEKLKKIGNTHVSVSHDGEYIHSLVLVEEPRT